MNSGLTFTIVILSQLLFPHPGINVRTLLATSLPTFKTLARFLQFELRAGPRLRGIDLLHQPCHAHPIVKQTNPHIQLQDKEQWLML